MAVGDQRGGNHDRLSTRTLERRPHSWRTPDAHPGSIPECGVGESDSHYDRQGEGWRHQTIDGKSSCRPYGRNVC